MAYRRIRDSDFIGKTVSRIDSEAINYVRFYFTDGSSISLETERVVGGVMGIMAFEEKVGTPQVDDSM
jgi:hypothetical protein